MGARERESQESGRGDGENGQTMPRKTGNCAMLAHEWGP